MYFLNERDDETSIQKISLDANAPSSSHEEGGAIAPDRNPVEHIMWHDQHIATIIRADFMPEQTTFVTPDRYYQQAGFVVYPAGGTIARHSHLPLQRHLVGTPETLIVRKGRLEVELYALDKSFICNRILDQGDIILLVAGGHCFHCREDVILLEIKQGPYTGLKEKEHF